MSDTTLNIALSWLEEMLYAERQHCKERDYALEARRTVEALEWLLKIVEAIKEGELKC